MPDQTADHSDHPLSKLFIGLVAIIWLTIFCLPLLGQTQLLSAATANKLGLFVLGAGIPGLVITGSLIIRSSKSS